MSIRKGVLDTAKSLITGDRQEAHGSFAKNAENIARLWTSWLGHEVKPTDVGPMLALFKIARARSNPHHRDNWVDLCGYAALSAEVFGDGQAE
jgi:hypothetical protein